MPPSGTILDFLEHGPDRAIGQAEEAFKPGKTATHPLGVLYQAPWQGASDGFAEHARRCAVALSMTGVPVHLRGIMGRIGYAGTDEEAAIERELAPLLHASIGRYALLIHQLVPTETLLYAMTTHQFLEENELRVVNAHRIMSNVWERDRITNAMAEALNRCGQVWVACHANAEMLARCGVTAPIRVVPVPHLPNDPHLKLRDRQRKQGPPRFYHIGKWEPRKAQDRIVLAFMRAFEPGEAHLLLKTSEGAPKFETYPAGPAQAVQAALADDAVKANAWTGQNINRSIHLITRTLPKSQLIDLHGFCDVYVSLSRGEGWDMPAADAKLAGNMMVYTPSGGPQDFATEKDLGVPITGTVKPDAFYRWEGGACYLDYDIDVAVAAMRAAAERVRSGDGRDRCDLGRLSAEAVGAKMRAYAEEVAGPLPQRS